MRAVGEGNSPALEMQREKRRLTEAKTFRGFIVRWMKSAKMAETTRSTRKSIIHQWAEAGATGGQVARVTQPTYLQSIGLWCVHRINSTDFTTVFRDFVGYLIANRSQSSAISADFKPPRALMRSISSLV